MLSSTGALVTGVATGDVAGDWDCIVAREDKGAEVKWRLEEKEGVEGGKEGDDATTVAAAAIEARCSSLPGEGATINDSRFELRVFLISCGKGGRSVENE